MKISKEFTWEMSHRIKDHKGLCKNIHGHTYKMELSLTGSPADDYMLLDYYDMAQIVNPIIAEMDHAFLVSDDDGLMLPFLKENNFKHVVIPNATTAENIVKMLLERLAPEFQKFDNLTAIKVRIFETFDVFAEDGVKL